MNKKFYYLAIFSILSASGYAFSLEAPKAYEVQQFLSSGKIDGFVQIPKGGQYGTATKERPTFQELGVNHIYYPELALTAKWDRLSFTFDGKYETFKGKATLNQDLTSHNITIPKDSSIRTKHKYAYYSLYANYDFELTPKWTVTPTVGVSLFDFSYQFSATDKNGVNIAEKDSRKFHAGMPVIGVKTNYAFTDKTKVIFSLNSNIPMGSVKQYLDTSLMLSYNLYKNNQKELNVLGGLGYERLKFRDSQKEM